jgi:HPt (histidine-containing phosphotransfer) domain-containing protein
MPDEALIDWEQLDAIADGWQDEFLEIYREFLVEMPADLRRLGAAVAASDAAAVAKLAHRVKGSAANFGFEGVRRAMTSIEEDAKNGALDRAADLLAGAEQAFALGRAGIDSTRVNATGSKDGEGT